MTVSQAASSGNRHSDVVGILRIWHTAPLTRGLLVCFCSRTYAHPRDTGLLWPTPISSSRIVRARQSF
jgi:hypothetical protein